MQMSKFKMDDKVIDTTEFLKGTGTITEVALNPTRSARYHVDFKATNESGWFREEELKSAMPKLDSDGMAIGVGKLW